MVHLRVRDHPPWILTKLGQNRHTGSNDRKSKSFGWSLVLVQKATTFLANQQFVDSSIVLQSQRREQFRQITSGKFPPIRSVVVTSRIRRLHSSFFYVGAKMDRSKVSIRLVGKSPTLEPSKIRIANGSRLQ